MVRVGALCSNAALMMPNPSTRAMNRRVMLSQASALLVLSLCAAAVPVARAAPEEHALNITGGTFFGPGPMVDSPLPTGVLGHIEFSTLLNGETRFFNNGPEPPNIASELQVKQKPDGLLSDGTPFNEHVDGGVANVGQGAMRLLTVIPRDGPNHGQEIYHLGTDYNLHVVVDLALDPGFPQGIVVSKDLHITSGLLWVPLSLQSKAGDPGGTDQAGSMPSGAPLLGRLGDEDGDGLIDGTIIGASNVPLNHIFLPGAPVVQMRHFKSDIRIQPSDAALLTIAGVLNFQDVWDRAQSSPPLAPAAQAYVAGHLANYLDDMDRRLQSAASLIRTAERQRGSGTLSAALRRIDDSRNAIKTAHARLHDPGPDDTSSATINAIALDLHSVFQTLSGVVHDLAEHSQLKPQAT
jgi:hypothetical protein